LAVTCSHGDARPLGRLHRPKVPALPLESYIVRAYI